MTTRAAAVPLPSAEERIYIASQWRLIWWRFKRHKLAVASTVVVLLLYFVATFVEFLAPHDPLATTSARVHVPIQRIRFDGVRPFVYGITSERDPVTRAMIHVADKSEKHYIHWFVHGNEYKLLGLIRTDRHLIGVDIFDETKPMPFYPLGTDRLGRDLLSRVIYATRISMSIGLVGVTLSLFLGLLLGGISGYRGGRLDLLIQRLIELIRSIPTIPLWLALAAAVPQDWSIIKTYFAITIIISMIGWTTLAREVRGRFLAMREEDFVIAARLYGSGQLRIIFRHMLPSFFSHVIAVTTLAVP
ncbi:MAG: ABC transporter permease, partial [Dehalococcoidia bacterium]